MENFPGTNLKTLWEQTVAPLRARLDREEYQTWIEPLKPVAVGDGVLELAVPNRMFATWVEENFLAELSTAWVSASGKESRLRFTWDPGATQGELFPVPARQQQPEEAPPARAPSPDEDVLQMKRAALGRGRLSVHRIGVARAMATVCARGPRRRSHQW